MIRSLSSRMWAVPLDRVILLYNEPAPGDPIELDSWEDLAAALYCAKVHGITHVIIDPDDRGGPAAPLSEAITAVERVLAGDAAASLN